MSLGVVTLDLWLRQVDKCLQKLTCGVYGQEHMRTAQETLPNKRKRSCDLKGTAHNPEIMFFFANALVNCF